MTGRMEARLRRVEEAIKPPAPDRCGFVVEVPWLAWEGGSDAWAQQMERAARDHRERARYRGAVLVRPPRETREDWLARRAKRH